MRNRGQIDVVEPLLCQRPRKVVWVQALGDGNHAAAPLVIETSERCFADIPPSRGTHRGGRRILGFENGHR